MTKTIDLRIEQLRRLREDPDDVWHGAIVRMPSWITEETPQPYRPRMAVWLSERTTLAANGDLLRPGDPVRDSALEGLLCLARMEGIESHPRAVRIVGEELAMALADDLPAAGVKCDIVDGSPMIDTFMQIISERAVGAEGLKSSLDQPGVTVDVLRAFAVAAKEYYLAAPWNHLSSEDVIRVESGVPDRKLGCFTVLGAAGETYGMGFFSSKKEYEALMAAENPREFLPRGGRWGLTYGDLSELLLPESELWERENLPVAGFEAYPSLMLFDRKSIQLPDAKTLSFAESLLRAMAQTTEEEMDKGRWKKRVDTMDGEVEVELSLPAVLEAGKGKGKRKPSAPPPGEFPDQRLHEQVVADIHKLIAEQEFNSMDEINAFLQEKLSAGPVPHAGPTTPEEKARDLFYEALEQTGRVQIKLAREAIRLWPDCADAFVLLAEEMPDPERRKELFHQGMEAGRRALGETLFEDQVGHFWGIIETRPYMRACHGYADCLAAEGESEEALELWSELLRLNPEDNQGVRFQLVPELVVRGKIGEAGAVLAGFPDDATAVIGYSRALVSFCQGGETAKARRHLQLAVKTNPHVPGYVLQETPMQGWIDESHRIGSEEEAVIFAPAITWMWRAVPGATEWLAESLTKPKRKQRGKSAKKKKKTKRR
jgi:tetratricopeptide (TPR) repeat protein